MSKLDLECVRVFDEVFKTASVSKAAERLGIQQSAASAAINKLREHFEDILFSRTARGMQPTPFAESIRSSLRQVLASMDEAQASRKGFDPLNARRVFRICMTDISEIVLLPALLNHLRQVAPHLQVEAEKIGMDSPHRLQDGEVDLAVGFMPQLEAGFYQQALFAQHFVCLVAQKHPRIAQRLTKAAFAREGHVLVSASGTGHVIVDKLLQKADVKRHVVLRVPSFLGVARIVAETELIATVPARYGEIMSAREAIRILPVPHVLPQYTIKQHWHERFHTDPGNVWMRRTVAELMRG